MKPIGIEKVIFYNFQTNVALVKEATFTYITGVRECSPLLSATHHFNGIFCDFPPFFDGHPWGSDHSTD